MAYPCCPRTTWYFFLCFFFLYLFLFVDLAKFIDELFVEIHYKEPDLADFGWNDFSHSKDEAVALLQHWRDLGVYPFLFILSRHLLSVLSTRIIGHSVCKAQLKAVFLLARTKHK